MDIIGYEGLYKIYEDGRVWSIKRNKFLKPSVRRDGYYFVNLCKKGKVKPKCIHRLLAFNYIHNPDKKPFVDHIDRNRLNNNISNLRWVTSSENNINTKVQGNIQHRHIYITNTKNGKYNYKLLNIRITRNRKLLLHKSFNCSKYSLEEVVKIRNKYYIEFGIDIDD